MKSIGARAGYPVKMSNMKLQGRKLLMLKKKILKSPNPHCGYAAVVRPWPAPPPSPRDIAQIPKCQRRKGRYIEASGGGGGKFPFPQTTLWGSAAGNCKLDKKTPTLYTPFVFWGSDKTWIYSKIYGDSRRICLLCGEYSDGWLWC